MKNNIDINKDFVREYKDDSWRGFSAQEVVCISFGIGITFAVGVFSYYEFSIPLNMAMYPGLPFALPILIYGFYRYQGLTILELYREMRYERKIRHLTYVAGEYEYIPEIVSDRKEQKREAKQLRVMRRKYKKQLRKGGKKRWVS